MVAHSSHEIPLIYDYAFLLVSLEENRNIYSKVKKNAIPVQDVEALRFMRG
jgi:hypothetical protein